MRCIKCNRLGKGTFFLRGGLCWQCVPETDRCIKCGQAHKGLHSDVCPRCEDPNRFPFSSGEYVEEQIPKRKPKPKKRKGVYLLASDLGWHKIGCTSNLYKRLQTLQGWLPFETRLEHFIETEYYRELENSLHIQFAEKRIRNSEWFLLTNEDIEKIKSIGPD